MNRLGVQRCSTIRTLAVPTDELTQPAERNFDEVNRINSQLGQTQTQQQTQAQQQAQDQEPPNMGSPFAVLSVAFSAPTRRAAAACSTKACSTKACPTKACPTKACPTKPRLWRGFRSSAAWRSADRATLLQVRYRLLY